MASILRKALGIGLVIEFCFVVLLFLPRLSDDYDPKPFGVTLFMGFHLPCIWLLNKIVGLGMGNMVDVIPVAFFGWLQCSLLVWLASLMSKYSSRNTAD